MADIFTREKRSDIMSRIRSNGTTIEHTLYGIVRGALGPRWRIDRNVTQLPGQPDIVVPSLRVVMFADGCFFHNCPKHGHIPKSNRDYWEPKLARNLKRDRRERRRLRNLGYSVWRFWGHDFKTQARDSLTRKIEKRLQKRIAER